MRKKENESSLLPPSPTFWELARQALSTTVRGYDLLAPKFEATDYATPEDLVAESLQWAELHYPTPPHAVGADLACGTGRGARALSSSCSHVTGFDFSEGMLEEAKRLSVDFEGLRWVQADLSTVQLPHHSYDRIVTFGAWGHILPSFRTHLIEQILNSLKPGGLFLTVTADEPKLWQKRFWINVVFDLLMLLRNLFWFREFHMYYWLNNTKSLLRAFREQGAEPILESVPGYEDRPLKLFICPCRPSN